MQRFLTSKPPAPVRWQHFGHAAIGKAQAHTIALQQHQLALHTGEGRERRILFDLGHGQAQRPVIALCRQAQDLAGPAKSIPPAFAAIVQAGNHLARGVQQGVEIHRRIASRRAPSRITAGRACPGHHTRRPAAANASASPGRGSRRTPSCRHATHRSAAWPPTGAPPGSPGCGQAAPATARWPGSRRARHG
ncbi:hypothetical protein G6F50_014625 [Rhizopus delemar]|uniref:Uncharacterized protein n=1 Tax=Rhizopus delemar TaxID=936053 RepID=A0A9P6Y4S6_9FUNG|nr:hypothetical protein G6F50_014625 [Rhizopus delemar]